MCRWTRGACVSAFQLTIAPVVLGVLIRWKLPRTADQIGACGPTVAVLAFTLVSGGIVAASAEAIAANFGKLALAAFLLHICWLWCRLCGPKVLRYPESVARTVSIEVGMQNGGMAASLAKEALSPRCRSRQQQVSSAASCKTSSAACASWWKRRSW
jgi:BASS family bile acid:Na+ symporter